MTDSTLSTFVALDGDNLAVQDWPLASQQVLRGVVLLVHGLANMPAAMTPGRSAQRLGLCGARLRPIWPWRVGRTTRRSATTPVAGRSD